MILAKLLYLVESVHSVKLNVNTSLTGDFQCAGNVCIFTWIIVTLKKRIIEPYVLDLCIFLYVCYTILQ